MLALAQANGAGSMEPAAPPGKPRCWVSEDVGCPKVQRERGPGFCQVSPAQAESFEPFFLGGCQEDPRARGASFAAVCPSRNKWPIDT